MRSDGFTLVEVIVGLGVMTIGAMALIGMQQQTTRGNVRAREVTVATQIAQNVIERLKLDGVAWNTVSQPPAPAADLANSPLLLPVVGSTVGSYLSLPVIASTLGGTTRTLSNAFDMFGDDVVLAGATTQQQASVRYCASYRLTWVYQNFRALRADVRVWWSKEVPSRAILTDFNNCQDDNSLNPGGTQDGNYHIVYLSTVLRPG